MYFHILFALIFSSLELLRHQPPSSALSGLTPANTASFPSLELSFTISNRRPLYSPIFPHFSIPIIERVYLLGSCKDPPLARQLTARSKSFPIIAKDCACQLLLLSVATKVY
jgi:hypothetical protein